MLAQKLHHKLKKSFQAVVLARRIYGALPLRQMFFWGRPNH
jgi:hypothetical protein